MFTRRKAGGGGVVDLVRVVRSDKNTPSHNRDAYYKISWGVDADGNFWRTNSRSLYRPVRKGEMLPDSVAEILV